MFGIGLSIEQGPSRPIHAAWFRYSETHEGVEVTVSLRHVIVAALIYQKIEIFTDTIPRISHLKDLTIDITLQPGCCYAGTLEVEKKFITNSME
jgi:hypothetical protein